ncbi:hypothetical protein DTY81_16705 [Escherichia coli]|nr:hypothetical protein [Escherichia coli]EGD5143007.1 hypothetical protein [Escherichia coli]EIH7424899.1 hypothetical protein [Escherichia coli]ODQ02880.1 hypothetical protein BGK51_16275 [Shigella sp. FC569]
MGWKYKEIIIPTKPQKPSFILYGIFLITAIGSGAALFIFHAVNPSPFFQTWNIWLFSCLPVMFFLLAFSLRCYIYGIKLRQWDILNQETIHIKNEWEQWAVRYIAVIGGCVLFPNKITASFLFEHSDSVESQWGLAKRIDYMPKCFPLTEQALHSLLYGIKNAIDGLPSDAELHITLLTDTSGGQSELITSLLSDKWKRIFPDKHLPDVVLVTENHVCNMFERRMTLAEEYFELLLVMQLNGDGQYSDGLAALLLGSDDLICKYKIHSVSRLLRPMPLDKENIEQDFSLFFNIQHPSRQAKVIIGDSKDALHLLPSVFSVGNECGIRCNAEKSIFLEMFSGLPGPFSDWLGIAFAVDVSDFISSPTMIISSSGGWVNTVIPEAKMKIL